MRLPYQNLQRKSSTRLIFRNDSVDFRKLSKAYSIRSIAVDLCLATVLSNLSKNCDLEQGRALHATILKRSFDSQTEISNALINLYAKCGDIAVAESAFRQTEIKDVVTWNSLIGGYLRNGAAEKAAFCLKEMIVSGVSPDQVTLSGVLSACSTNSPALQEFGKSVHGIATRLGQNSHSSVANSLVSFYSKSGNIDAAKNIFKDLILKTVVSWNSMLDGFFQNRKFDHAVDLLGQMFRAASPIQPDSVTVIIALQLFSELCLLSQGMAIHCFTVRRIFCENNLSIQNSLLDMYMKCGHLIYAQNLFDEMPHRDIISWNTIISGYSRFLRKESWRIFRELLRTGLRCSVGTVLAITPSFTSPEECLLGRSIHGWMNKSGFPNIVSATNALILMYINFKDLPSSSLLFNCGGLAAQSDIVSWNSVIVGHVQNGYYEASLTIFRSMIDQSHPKPDHITMVSIFAACGLLDLIFLGKSLHGFTLKLPMGSHLRLGNSLITMYCRCKDMQSSESVFFEINLKNLCSWNCMISGYVQSGESNKALDTYRRMGDNDCHPDEMTIVGLLCACAHLGTLEFGRDIHGYALRHGMHINAYVSSAIIDMYGKCGYLDSAAKVFETLGEEKSVASWNSMILAYGFHGHCGEAIRLFSEMGKKGISPNKSTFISVLSACSHCGLVDEGWEHFKKMANYGINASAEHRVCMVDMLGRAGRFNEACEFITSSPTNAESGVWGALLSACKDHDNVEMGKLVAEHLFSSEPKNVGYYISLSNLYAASEKWSDAVSVRNMIDERGLVKPPGCSFIDVCAK